MNISEIFKYVLVAAVAIAIVVFAKSAVMATLVALIGFRIVSD